jgi:hypothetical protein
VIDGVGQGPYEGIGNGTPLFSDDRKHYAYRAGRAGKTVVVADGVQSQEYDDIVGPTFAPHAQRLAYAGRRDDKWHIVVDGDETEEEYDGFFADSAFVWDSQRALRTVAVRD